MGSIYRIAELAVPADVAWDFIDRYARSEVHVFSVCTAERQDGEYRVVTLLDGREVRERNITVDPVRRRAVYTVPGHRGAEHHQAEMRIDLDPQGRPVLVWVTDFLPHRLAEESAASYDKLFAELVAAVNAHGARRSATR